MSSLITKLLSTTGGVAAETDEFFNQTTLLLHGDGTNGSQNNTFLDSSANGFTITRNGNTTQGSYSPYRSEWSNYFTAAADHLSFTADPLINIGADQFNIECWVYLISMGRYSAFYKGPTIGAIFLGLFDTTYRPLFAKEGTVILTGPDPLPLNEWVHVAASRDANNILRLFVNGILVNSITNTDNFSSSNMTIPGSSTDDELYISDFRLVKGTALYTSNFTPPTEPLTAVTGTSLLTCQSNRFIDNSSNGFAITVNGDTKVTPFSPYAPSDAYDPANEGGSGYFDGTGDYLSVADDAALEIGSGDFSIEFWYWADSWTHTTVIATKGYNFTNGYASWLILRRDNGGQNQLTFYGSTALTNFDIASRFDLEADVNLNQWNHYVVCREGGTLSTFANGVRVSTTTTTQAFFNYNAPVTIMSDSNGANAADGYLSNFRYVVGSSVYDPTATTVTVPTAPLTAVTNTSLLCNFTNAGIFDSTGKNVIETVGNAQIDTAVTKFGTGSMEFDGTGDYLRADNQNIGNFGTGDFTVEMWVYWTGSGSQTLIDSRASTGLTGWGLLANKGILKYYDNGDYRIIDSVNFPTNQWVHVAVSRSSSGAKLFKDGVQIGSTYTNITNLTDDNLTIGANVLFGANLNGYIDDLRITKGVARYTANFTPPTKAFPDQ